MATNIYRSMEFNDAGTSMTTQQSSGGTTSKGMLEIVGEQLDPTINDLGDKLETAIEALTNGGTSNPQAIAKYQQIYGEYIQANSVRASAVEKMQSLIDRILQKM